MAKHPPPKRSMRKGMRPVPFRTLVPPPNVCRETVEKMRKFLIEEVLADEKPRKELDDRQIFGVDHAYLVILFHQRKKSFQEVNKHGNEGQGHRVNFNEEQISAFNFVLLEEKEKGQLDTLLKKLEGKIEKN